MFFIATKNNNIDSQNSIVIYLGKPLKQIFILILRLVNIENILIDYVL